MALQDLTPTPKRRGMERELRTARAGHEKGRVEHWCIHGAALERFDARVYHGP